MNLPRRRLLHLAAGAVVLPVASRTARAQVYPSRPVTIIVPVPPGGVADPIARILADHLAVTLGQPVVIETSPARAAASGSAAPRVRRRTAIRSASATG
jgi:tripartite-type tricarboxylate transporter receptor subunit TctC